MASHRVSTDTVGGVASLPWVMVKVLFCTRPSLTLPQCGGGRLPAGLGRKVQFLMWSLVTLQGSVILLSYY